jgi:hypothetical protein
MFTSPNGFSLLGHTLDPSSKFSNCRDWRTFLSAAQQAAAYSGVATSIATAGVATAFRSGQAWLAKNAATANRLWFGGDLAPGKALGA